LGVREGEKFVLAQRAEVNGRESVAGTQRENEWVNEGCKGGNQIVLIYAGNLMSYGQLIFTIK